MNDIPLAANSPLFLFLFLFLCLWFLSIALLYYIIKTAVTNGVEQANARLIESIRRIEDDVREIKTKKESV